MELGDTASKGSKKKDKDLMTAADVNKNAELQSSFNSAEYDLQMNKTLGDIQKKIKEANAKISSIKLKEEIINRMLTLTSTQLTEAENKEGVKNYKHINILNANLLKQFETLNMVQEMLLKHEDLIQRYMKMSLDIQNNRVNTFVKIKGAMKSADNETSGIEDVMKTVHEAINQMNNPSQGGKSIVEQAEIELSLSGYGNRPQAQEADIDIEAK